MKTETEGQKRISMDMLQTELRSLTATLDQNEIAN